MDRKEAIEVVRKNWPHSGYTMLREALETLLPELVESEDEKIRKDLIRWVNTNISYERMPVGMNYSNECVLAWLEKQGEQKSSWSEDDDIMVKKIIDGVTPLGECRDYPTEKQRKFYEECNEKIEWLKSLKQKSHWKPTEEQMQALNWIAYNYTLMDKGIEEKLQSLLNDLKKL